MRGISAVTTVSFKHLLVRIGQKMGEVAYELSDTARIPIEDPNEKALEKLRHQLDEAKQKREEYVKAYASAPKQAPQNQNQAARGQAVYYNPGWPQPPRPKKGR
jgi:hypothetical protein